ncbi:c-type cytochrome [Maribacter aestuarii]|uniref:c-type cytochrome n=1 Tax=Maribacter aestuarii TaxID=1130723 RepID=UPI00248C0B91|nr:c-type cytochrome [Maribacter aestuarii]
MKISHIGLFLICPIFMVYISCSSDNPVEVMEVIEDSEEMDDPDPIIIRTTEISASPQRPGNAENGKDYLINGDYMSSGIPYNAWVLAAGEDNSKLLNRTGDNAVISYDNTAISAFNGVRVVAPNCLNCHSSFINDTYIIGLGQHDGDYTQNRATSVPLLTSAINSIYGPDSDEAEAYGQFARSISAIGPKTVTASRGVNPADKIAEVLISHRDKNTLEWQDEPLISLPDEVIPTDVPAWWLLKKKNAMFYTGMSRMDFCKSFIGASLLTLENVVKAEEVDEKMEDVLAYIYSLEAPEYPFDIDMDLADQGKIVFDNNCVSCHGSYDAGDVDNYPNLLVALESIGTDPELSNHYTASTTRNSYFLDWFNNGWFGTYSSPLEIVPDGGYIAPPLDGIWATAPYFHNGSVPTLADVLNSKTRPIFWSRTFDNNDYDKELLGWNYSVETSQQDKNTYNTTLKGYGNGGHTFGDVLSDEERIALLEYLKTL